MTSDQDLIREFVIESLEHVDQMEQTLLTLEGSAASPELLAQIFRAIHTIKGTCGFLGFSKLEAVTHSGENLLSRLRDGVLQLDPELVTILLRLVDAVRVMLNHVAACSSDNDGTTNYGKLIALMNERARTDEVVTRPSEPEATDVVAAIVPPPEPVHEPLAARTGTTPPPSTTAEDAKPATADPKGGAAESTIRVDVQILDKLMNLVGELVLARNQFAQFDELVGSTVFSGSLQRLSLVTSELQDVVMRTRMQPVGTIWQKFPRLVREVALACGKSARLEMEGEQTGLDRSILEAIKDPLTHLIRNSVDHGLESPEQRVQRGKPSEGKLSLRAVHEGGQVNIEIADDGSGINTERVKQKALQQALVSAEVAARMTDREAVNLIFLPGFSTADKVTNISGRGVGMDVVKTNIERIGGTIDIDTQLGKGTTVRIKIPLTLAIVPALIVTAGGLRYPIPQASLLEVVLLDAEQAARHVDHIDGAGVYRLRGSLLPLVDLEALLNGDSQADTIRARSRDSMSIVVLQATGRRFGIVVGGIGDTEEIVVKPLGRWIKTLGVYAGATIMGDGVVSLILDAVGLAREAGLLKVHDRVPPELARHEGPSSSEQELLLLFQIHDDGRMAIPLSAVSRLEEIPRSIVEHAGRERVLLYRDEILPLIYLSSALRDRRKVARTRARRSSTSAPGETLKVVVYKSGAQSVGLVVERILDIAETSLDIRRQASREGILYSVVVQDHIVEVVDVDWLVNQKMPNSAYSQGQIG